MSNVVDLSRLPAPNVVEPLSYEAIYTDMRSDLQSLDPAFSALTDADPALKVLQVAALRELNIRQRVNDAARAVMLAHASGSDLDNIVAREPYNIQRLTVDAGDSEAIPPVPPVYESDEALRRRAQLAPTRYSTAGPEDAYRFFALSADGRVADVSVVSPEGGRVVVTVLSHEGDGTATQELLDIVHAALTPRLVRPLTDMVEVQSATVVDYSIVADLILYTGPDDGVVLSAAEARANAYAAESRLLGREISESAVTAALHVQGVHKVTLTSPAGDIPIAPHEFPNLTGIELQVIGRYE